MSRPIALVTGATSGIGAEFTRQLADRGHDLVIVARDLERLELAAATLRANHGVEVEVLATDLTSAEGLAAVEARLASSTNPVDMLVNNAGLGLRKQFDENEIDVELASLELLVTAPLRLTHAALRQMLPRGSGTIVNIASIAAYAPRGTYSAAKAWLLSFSRWANLYYRPRGVSVTAVAPGFVRTEFHERMGVRTNTIPGFLWLEAEQLVRVALRDIAKGRSVSIPTLRYKVVVGFMKLMPLRVTTAGMLHER